ncbi:MAG: ParA family protein [Oscillospiraceae bacterium]|nr:ParA family protein [Oscillospiraceae bacterium]
MARISVLANQKGGVGKTTTAAAMTAGLTARGYNVLAIDADPQCNLSHTLQAGESGKGLFDVLSGEPVADIIQRKNNVCVLRGQSSLTGADKIFTDIGMEYLLHDAIEPLQAKFDYIIIDCPPQLGILTVNALVACTDIVIPITTDMYAMQGLSQLLLNVQKVKKRPNPNIKIDGILLTRYNRRSILNRDLRESIEVKAVEMGTKVYKTVIRESVAIRESQAQRMNIFDYAPNSNGPDDYNKFIDEYINSANLNS